MKLLKTSILTGTKNEMDLDVTVEQLDRWLAGELAQDVFPHLNEEEREFILTGITPVEWEAAFPPEEREVKRE